MKIAIVAGSNRKAATSTSLAHYIQTIMELEGVQVSFVDLYQSPVPFYNPDEDYEEHPALINLKRVMNAADAIVLATPEYHSSISGVLKNALDHLGQEHFSGKVVLSVSSAGGAVAVSSLTQLQTIVRNLHGINSPEWISIGGDQRKSLQSDVHGSEIHPDLEKRVRRVVAAFLQLVGLVSSK
ncbi:NAD(P)H-dependent oxidoreductase [Paenibacillus sp. SYP-B3998]|uniref:NAD(P)H-dependent oxidoreductase n=1 Tax=Paenibacillus sp. SYP-B3998 TaxID=2678564 RepID=A0A6G4A1A6_9BACL|nr:NADPH-dependent FMN reductase [Paenibacillus sp. SYP-B3998]NEW08253.1 NAD(P)H-dependent oxidoreductase [Paenibacillus sp. SYP-B3998]